MDWKFEINGVYFVISNVVVMKEVPEIKPTEVLRVIQFSDLFPEQTHETPKVSTLLQGIDRESLCVLTGNMMSRLSGMPFFDSQLSFQDEKRDFIRFFLSRYSLEFADDILKRYKQFVRASQLRDVEYVATSRPAIMAFQREFFALEPDKFHFDPKIEHNFFKALLLINERIYNADCDEDNYKDEPFPINLAYIYLAFNYSNEDVEASDIYGLLYSQIAKCVTFFTFMFNSKDRRLKVMRRRFMEHYGIRNWTEYVIPHIMAFYRLSGDCRQLRLNGGKKFIKSAKRVISASCIDKDDIIPVSCNDDFMMFRSKPFIRLKKHCYVVTSLSFLIEHMYNSLYFELKQYCKEAGFKSDKQFRQFYTTEFSHIYMFEKYVSLCTPSNREICIPGSLADQLKTAAKHKGKDVVPPDYYMRLSDGCVLFEFKDALSSAKVKECRNPEEYLKLLRERFFNIGSHKGVPQIIKNVECIQKGTFFYDKPCQTSLIYPVLVIDNPSFTIRGVRVILEKMMRDECHKRYIDSRKLRPLILMDVATLKIYADYIRTNGLVKTFEEYYEYVGESSDIVKKDQFITLISFSEYLKRIEAKPNMCSTIKRIMREAKSH